MYKIVANRLVWVAALLALGAAPMTFATASKSSDPAKADFKQPKTLAQLLALSPEELEKVDIALIDLLCAEGLAGAESLDIQKSIETLDQWAEYVKTQTERNYHQFEEHPEKFQNSLARYRMAVMAVVLTKQLGMQYNPERLKQLENGHKFRTESDEVSFFTDSSDVFLHGLLSENRYGTCASMPFLYVAIGRRLGYPVTLATTRSHYYVRYEEGDGKHLNVEATEHRGFVTPSDEEYKNPWEMHLSQAEIDGQGMLRPMSNKEILGHVLGTRAACLRSAGRHNEEAEVWTTAARYLPDTLRWKEIVQNMHGAAKFDEDQKWRQELWKEVARYPIPQGPGFAYFQDKKVRLHFFMNQSLDRAAIEKAIANFKSELAEYSGAFVKNSDSRPKLNLLLQSPDQPGKRLVLKYKTPWGVEVKIPADFLPPFEFGEIPQELKNRIVEAKLEDSDSILEMMWRYYDGIAQAKANAKMERMTSTSPVVMISEANIPPEFRHSIPEELEVRISGLRGAQAIVDEMWAYRAEQQARQQEEADRNRMAMQMEAMELMRHHGISPPPGGYHSSVSSSSYQAQGSNPTRMGYLDYSPQARALASLREPFPDLNDKNPVPPAYREWLTPEVASKLSHSEIWQLQQNEKNRQTSERFREYNRLMKEGYRLKRLLPYQIVPVDMAERNLAVEHTVAPVASIPQSNLSLNPGQ